MSEQAKDPTATPGPDLGPIPDPRPEPAADKVEKMADEALEAGRDFSETEAGRKVVDAADTLFEKGEALARKAKDSDIGRKVSATAEELADKAMETEVGKKVAATADDLGKQAMASEAGQTAKKVWNTPLGRNVGTGAAAGAAIGLVVPFFGPIIGATIGGGLGYLRSLSKKPKAD